MTLLQKIGLAVGHLAVVVTLSCMFAWLAIPWKWAVPCALGLTVVLSFVVSHCNLERRQNERPARHWAEAEAQARKRRRPAVIEERPSDLDV